MNILITGSDGFIGKNLLLALQEKKNVRVTKFTKINKPNDLNSMINDVDLVFHLAGVNRSDEPKDFTSGNIDLAQSLCNAIAKSGRAIPVVFTSSIQASYTNLYGSSKRVAEEFFVNLRDTSKISLYIFRLPNVFGKWCKPNYNSVIATFCHNIARSIPIYITNPDTILNLVYIDDLIRRFVEIIDGSDPIMDSDGFEIIETQYQVNIQNLANLLHGFKRSRETLLIDRVGSGLIRALYSTYLSYLPVKDFSYKVAIHNDVRGKFIEMLKTQDSGQFSFFTVNPGFSRGEHYHNSKTEKFLVVKGEGIFKFRNMTTNEICEIFINDGNHSIIDSIPGWTHSIKNLGDSEMIVMLWANENFDFKNPDTYRSSI